MRTSSCETDGSVKHALAHGLIGLGHVRTNKELELVALGLVSLNQVTLSGHSDRISLFIVVVELLVLLDKWRVKSLCYCMDQLLEIVNLWELFGFVQVNDLHFNLKMILKFDY